MALPKVLAESVTRLAHDARFIFTGRVEAAGASSLAVLSGKPNSVVVRIERIHRAAPALQNQAGQLVTVLGAAGEGGAGRRKVYFTNPVLYGETLGVKELGSVDAPEEDEEVHTFLAGLTEEAKTEELRRHLASADAVLHARVLRRHRVSEATAATVSEHDPDWWAAVLSIVASLKGSHEGEITVRYPNSRNVRWHAVPKPHDGQEAVFLLHRDGLRVGDATLALLHPTDLMAADARDLRRIKGLL